jgi:large subunit ribosomal protein L25
MKKYQLTVTPREGTGRSASRRLRKAQKIPAILYGKHTKPETLSVAAPEFTKLLKEIAGGAALVELKREQAGAAALSVLQEIQRDPITDRYLHIDLQEVKENEKMVINVTVHTTGESTGVKNEGGILDVASHRLLIRCLPKDLPTFIEVDVTDLAVGEALHVSDLKPIPGVEFLGDKNQAVVLCVEPPAEEVAAVVAAPVEGAAPAEGAAAPADGAAAAPAAGADGKPAAPAKPGDAKAAAPAAAGAKPAAPAKK